MRGNHGERAGLCGPDRSIPACAGEPTPSSPAPKPFRVYPRVCGGTLSACGTAASARGLSPRVRGNPNAGRSWRGSTGSIPACAGEPPFGAFGFAGVLLYPRVCGGTTPGVCARCALVGLSPRVRGNRLKARHTWYYERSIPACAGEPSPSQPSCPPLPVYPRVCGGTNRAAVAYQRGNGLSPHVRGNPPPAPLPPSGRRSIPACAGEPHLPRHPRMRRRVYPRVCGGTYRRA